MGYDLHIIRGVELSDPDLEMHDEATATSSAGETVEYRNEGLAMRTAHPDRSAVWVDYRGG